MAEFERVEWSEMERRRLKAHHLYHLAFILGIIAIFTVFAYHRTADRGIYLIFQWNVDWEDWLMMIAGVGIIAYMLLPAIVEPATVRMMVTRLKGRWGSTASAVGLAGIASIGFWSILRGFTPRITYDVGTNIPDIFQPPMGFRVDSELTRSCVGPEVGPSIRETECVGTWTFPLGTDRWGYEMTDLLIVGAEPVAYIVIVTLGIIVPIATIFGVYAGYYGGWVDDLLMGYVDVQLSIPAMILYLLAYMFILDTMIMFLVAFGLLSWGGIARIVRSETLQRRESGYITAARSVGAPDAYIIRRHVIPNVTNSIIPATFHLIAIMVLTEAGLSFLGFTPSFQSWGMTIAEGLQYGPPLEIWWVSTIPALAVVGTVVCCKLAGDGLRDVFDPRGERP